MAVLVWDFDNTLAYRDGLWAKTMLDVLKYNGYHDYTVDELRTYFQEGFPWHRHQEAHKDYFNGKTWWEYINTLILNAFVNCGFNEHESIRLTNQFKDVYLNIESWNLFDDTTRNLDYSINEGHLNYILSNHTPDLFQLVTGLGIEKYFEKVISSGQVGYEKPNRMIFNEILKYVGKSAKVYVIGDNYIADIQGAIESGFEAIMVRQENKLGYKNYSKNLDGIWQYIAN